jgi:arsenate reductase
MEVIAYHDDACRLSLQALTAHPGGRGGAACHRLRKAPPARRLLRKLANNTGLPMREFLRKEDPLYGVLRLDDPRLSDEDLIDAMEDHPSLIAAPIVVPRTRSASAARKSNWRSCCRADKAAAAKQFLIAKNVPFKFCAPNMNSTRSGFDDILCGRDG